MVTLVDSSEAVLPSAPCSLELSAIEHVKKRTRITASGMRIGEGFPVSSEVDRLQVELGVHEARLAEVRKDRKAKQQQLRREQRSYDKARQYALDVALVLYVKTCPDASFVIKYLRKHHHAVFEGDLDAALQDHLERTYLALPLADVGMLYERTGRIMRPAVFREAARVEVDMKLLDWIVAMNRRQGVAPSYRMVSKQKRFVMACSEGESFPPIYSAGEAAEKKWCQRFRLRCQLQLAALPARPVLPPEDLAFKAHRPSSQSKRRPGEREK